MRVFLLYIKMTNLKKRLWNTIRPRCSHGLDGPSSWFLVVSLGLVSLRCFLATPTRYWWWKSQLRTVVHWPEVSHVLCMGSFVGLGLLVWHLFVCVLSTCFICLQWFFKCTTVRDYIHMSAQSLSPASARPWRSSIEGTCSTCNAAWAQTSITHTQRTYCLGGWCVTQRARSLCRTEHAHMHSYNT